MQKKIIGKGAEAIIYLKEGKAVKERIQKDYRIKEIDERFRRFRTRREAKVLEKLAEIGFPAPKVIAVDDKRMLVNMELIKGSKLRDVLEKKDHNKICREIGKRIVEMHNTSIIHGDLTTSNMILKKEKNKDSEEKVYFIDFGLSFFSTKIEDMAVDLHLVRQALESKHYRVWEDCFKEVLKGYKENSKNADAVISRLDVVEMRGRYKKKAMH